MKKDKRTPNRINPTDFSPLYDLYETLQNAAYEAINLIQDAFDGTVLEEKPEDMASYLKAYGIDRKAIYAEIKKHVPSSDIARWLRDKVETQRVYVQKRFKNTYSPAAIKVMRDGMDRMDIPERYIKHKDNTLNIFGIDIQVEESNARTARKAIRRIEGAILSWDEEEAELVIECTYKDNFASFEDYWKRKKQVARETVVEPVYTCEPIVETPASEPVVQPVAQEPVVETVDETTDVIEPDTDYIAELKESMEAHQDAPESHQDAPGAIKTVTPTPPIGQEEKPLRSDPKPIMSQMMEDYKAFSEGRDKAIKANGTGHTYLFEDKNIAFVYENMPQDQVEQCLNRYHDVLEGNFDVSTYKDGPDAYYALRDKTMYKRFMDKVNEC